MGGLERPKPITCRELRLRYQQMGVFFIELFGLNVFQMKEQTFRPFNRKIRLTYSDDERNKM